MPGGGGGKGYVGPPLKLLEEGGGAGPPALPSSYAYDLHYYSTDEEASESLKYHHMFYLSALKSLMVIFLTCDRRHEHGSACIS